MRNKCGRLRCQVKMTGADIQLAASERDFRFNLDRILPGFFDISTLVAAWRVLACLSMTTEAIRRKYIQAQLVHRKLT